jgi:hypothetical protein
MSNCAVLPRRMDDRSLMVVATILILMSALDAPRASRVVTSGAGSEVSVSSAIMAIATSMIGCICLVLRLGQRTVIHHAARPDRFADQVRSVWSSPIEWARTILLSSRGWSGK